MEEMDKQCAACGKEEEGHLFECHHCHIARYCTKVCRKAHWKEHQQHCKVYEEDCDDQYGKHLVARRDLKPGEIILQEEPLVIAFKKNVTAPLFCVGCCSFLNGDLADAMRCPECNWPMCGQNKCWAEGSAHSLGECVLLKASGCRVTIDDITSHQSSLNNVYYAIMILRCLSLRLRDPEEWEKLMELGKDSKLFGKSSIELEEAGVRGKVDVNAVLELLKRWIPFSANTASKETVGKLCRLFFDHGVAILGFQGVDHASSACAVYSVASLIAHSCVANATRTFSNDGQIVVRTAVPIPKGARIFLNHIMNTVCVGTYLRRTAMAEKLKLVNCYCSCDRCKDPTELGTYSSGVYCSECPANDDAGILLPEDPLDDKSDWICNKCPAVSKTMTEFHKTVAEEFKRVQSEMECDVFIGKYSKILHSHHFYLIKVKNRLLQHYFFVVENGFMSSELLDKMVPLVYEMLEVVNVLSPGLTSNRGSYLERISRVMSFQISRLQHRNRVHLASNTSNMDHYTSELTSLVKARKKIMEELLIHLSFQDGEMTKSIVYKEAIIDFIQIDRLLQKVKIN